MNEIIANWNYRNPWYHGSPYELTSIRTGSTITQEKGLARVFSHKPVMVSIEDDRIRHMGTQPGFLYIIAEDIEADDVYPHPQTTMGPGLEWLTKRELQVTLLGPTQIVADELLTEADIEALKRRMQSDEERR